MASATPRPLRRRLLQGAAVLLATLGVVAAGALIPLPAPTPAVPEVAVPDDFSVWFGARLAASEAAGAWPVATERVVRNRAGKADVVFVYVHGFGATRGEGEHVVDLLAREWSANAYYVRLPGHGTNMDDHAAATHEAYLQTVAEALAAAELLGDKTVLVGTSTGALLATWAAATYPDRVDGLILASPFYDYRDSYVKYLAGSLLGVPLVKLVSGDVRDAGWRSDPEGRVGPNYNQHWLTQQRFEAIARLEEVRRVAGRPDLFPKVVAPALVFVHYADEQHRDGVINIDAARTAYARFNGGTPQPASRLVDVADGSHVLFSEHIRTDKDTIVAACREFLRATVGPTPREQAALAAPPTTP